MSEKRVIRPLSEIRRERLDVEKAVSGTGNRLQELRKQPKPTPEYLYELNLYKDDDGNYCLRAIFSTEKHRTAFRSMWDISWGKPELIDESGDTSVYDIVIMPNYDAVSIEKYVENHLGEI